jgi:Protein of unknown function (DUF2778)
MTCTAETFPGVTAFDRRIFNRRISGARVPAAAYSRTACRGVGIGLGTVTTAGLMAGTAAVAAAWIVATALGGAPHLKARIPLFAGTAIAGLPPAFAHSPDRTADRTLVSPPRSAERDKGPRLRAPFPRRQADEGEREGAALAAQGNVQNAAALPQLEAAPPSGYVAAAVNLFDPEPTVVAALAPATPAAPQPTPPSVATAERVDAAPPSSHLPRRLELAALRAGAAVAAAAKPALPQVADAEPATPSGLTGFLRKLFGRQPANDGPSVMPPAGGHTAIYDIAAHTVYLPDGTRLEAHSGMGRIMDDPRYVNEKDRGATPPNVYDLVLREGSFHGVQAIRLTPVNDDKMFGRDGILAHPYMLGVSGQSFGCVSFKDYPEFLKAFESGEVDRLVVVPHRGDYPRYAAND